MKNEIRILVYLVMMLYVTLTGAFISIVPQHWANEKTKTTTVIDKPLKPELSEIASRGKSLFKTNCAACHNMNMKADMTGPALGGVLNRWDGNTAALTDFIRNPQVYLDTKADKRLKDLRKKYGTTMQSFPNITDDEVQSIMAYIEAR